MSHGFSYKANVRSSFAINKWEYVIENKTNLEHFEAESLQEIGTFSLINILRILTKNKVEIRKIIKIKITCSKNFVRVAEKRLFSSGIYFKRRFS